MKMPTNCKHTQQRTLTHHKLHTVLPDELFYELFLCLPLRNVRQREDSKLIDINLNLNVNYFNLSIHTLRYICLVITWYKSTLEV